MMKIRLALRAMSDAFLAVLFDVILIRRVHELTYV